MHSSQADIQPVHLSVLLDEVLQFLNPQDGKIYVDGNLGLGGHSGAILKASSPGGRVIGFDWDQEAKYFYYKHGPLARKEIGDKKVQGVDYAYTINGWLKGANSDAVSTGNDQAEDGVTTSTYLARNRRYPELANVRRFGGEAVQKATLLPCLVAEIW